MYVDNKSTWKSLHLSVKGVTFLIYLKSLANHYSLHTNGFRYSPFTLAASYVVVLVSFTIGLNFSLGLNFNSSIVI